MNLLPSLQIFQFVNPAWLESLYPIEWGHWRGKQLVVNWPIADSKWEIEIGKEILSGHAMETIHGSHVEMQHKSNLDEYLLVCRRLCCDPNPFEQACEELGWINWHQMAFKQIQLTQRFALGIDLLIWLCSSRACSSNIETAISPVWSHTWMNEWPLNFPWEFDFHTYFLRLADQISKSNAQHVSVFVSLVSLKQTGGSFMNTFSSLWKIWHI